MRERHAIEAFDAADAKENLLRVLALAHATLHVEVDIAFDGPGALAEICRIDPKQCGEIDLMKAAARPLCPYMVSLDQFIENPGDRRTKLAALPGDLPAGRYRFLIRFRRIPYAGGFTIYNWGPPVEVTSNPFYVER